MQQLFLYEPLIDSLSSNNSASVSAILSFKTGSHLIPLTISTLPSPCERQGKEKMRPSLIPYGFSSEWRAIENHSPSGVGTISDLIVSMTALAAEAAEDFPRAAMTAAPLFCIALIKSCSSQRRSLITSVNALPEILTLRKSGTCVAEWLPQTVNCFTSATETAALLASMETARF